MHLTSPLLESVPGLVHGFGTRDEPIPMGFLKDWEILRPQWKQVHGTAISRVESHGQECGEVDGLYTLMQGLPLAIVTADCVPILLAHKKGGKVAAVHSGWRGTRGRILVQLMERLKLHGENPRDWVAAIGPAIGPCCYEVSDDLAQNFLQEFSSFNGCDGESFAVPRYRRLDLPAINAALLKELGLGEVEILRFCTFCSETPRFQSYRRDGKGTRQWSMIRSD